MDISPCSLSMMHTVVFLGCKSLGFLQVIEVKNVSRCPMRYSDVFYDTMNNLRMLLPFKSTVQGKKCGGGVAWRKRGWGFMEIP